MKSNRLVRGLNPAIRTNGLGRGPPKRTLEGVYVCDWSITTGILDEFAERLPGHQHNASIPPHAQDISQTAEAVPQHAEWRVSWLPGRLLTRDQAIAAIELVELLYAPAPYSDAACRAAIAAAAELVGVRPIDAAATLSERHPRP